MKANQRGKTTPSDQLQQHNQKTGSHYNPDELKKVNEHIRLLKQVNKDIHSFTDHYNNTPTQRKTQNKRRNDDQDRSRSDA